jgi:hypothetical protein
VKKIISLLKDYIQNTFHLPLYLSLAVFLTALIIFNYRFDFENSYLDTREGHFGITIAHALFSGSIYLISCAIVYFFKKNEIENPFKKTPFWLFFLFFISCYGFYRGGKLENISYSITSNYDEMIYYWKNIDNIEDILTGVVPFFILYLVYDKKKIGHFYGIRTEKVDFKPYFLLFGLMILPIFAASLTSDFKIAYPIANKSNYQYFAFLHELKAWQTFLLFEFLYLFSFLAVELMYRGFLIFKMENYLGQYVVLPMVIIYAVLHFGKPLGETLGSIGGGYILGILALKTKNIWGGIFVHIGVAALMEFFSIL